jgi:hypothetical protein
MHPGIDPESAVDPESALIPASIPESADMTISMHTPGPPFAPLHRPPAQHREKSVHGSPIAVQARPESVLMPAASARPPPASQAASQVAPHTTSPGSQSPPGRGG